MQRRSVQSTPRDVPERAVREGQPEHAHRGSSVVPDSIALPVRMSNGSKSVATQTQTNTKDRCAVELRAVGASQLRLDALHFRSG